MIIWLASYPRSGNTYFRVLLKQYFGISTYSVYEDRILSRNSKIQKVVGHESRSRSIESLLNDPKIYIVKTHDLPKEDNLPAIYLVRDGRDTLVSYAHYIQSFESRQTLSTNQLDDFSFLLHDLIMYNESFGGWGQNVLAWTNHISPSSIIKFENLIQSDEPWKIVEKGLDSVYYPFSYRQKEQVIPSFNELHKQMPDFFREGKIGNGKKEMPKNLHELFWKKHGEAMKKMGYSK